MSALQMRQSLLPRRATHCRPVVSLRHRSVILQVIQDLPDGRRIFNGGNDLDCAAAVIARLNVDVDQFAGSELKQPKVGPQGEGQDARSKTRFRRFAQVMAACFSIGVLCSESTPGP